MKESKKLQRLHEEWKELQGKKPLDMRLETPEVEAWMKRCQVLAKLIEKQEAKEGWPTN